jgi:hypothetical protein
MCQTRHETQMIKKRYGLLIYKIICDTIIREVDVSILDTKVECTSVKWFKTYLEHSEIQISRQ